MHWQYAPVDTAPLFQAAKSGDVRALAQVALTIAENSNATIAALQRQLEESQRQLEESRQETHVQALQVRSLQMSQADAPLYVGPPPSSQQCSGGACRRSLSPLGELLAEPDLAEIEQSRGASTISALDAGGTQQREPGPGFE